MSSSTTPVLFEMYRGNDIGFLVKIRDSEGAAVNITGWQFLTTMKRGPTGDDDSSAPVQVDSGELAGADAENGDYYLLLPSAQTKNLGPGLYYIDVKQVVDNIYTTTIYGRVRVNATVTQRTAA